MNWLVALAALSGAIAVGAGAFGAHGAEGKAAEWLRTGGTYQLIHAVAALVAVQMGAKGPGWLFVAGGALFAGTLYAMALGAPRWLGAITPIGGAALIAAWLWLAWHARQG
ncbi:MULTISPECIES: DUF423 domain-containing protein [unclassified Sphingomonas]|uniref:DUF423 domain-containing protein n=1 Tax=unclassified Sphingomonas TaxID=196159 RepID=UPI002151B5BE|nr:MULTISPECIES: DUF423 domain-containing protein [unclassified Sphingomonas]MCR5872710.1 DUF423 domain-containing protein [Sphingomonas sp. J344]UUX99005.1 DUF423 domain-containing protein [Sphingomonas sp. J315]